MGVAFGFVKRMSWWDVFLEFLLVPIPALIGVIAASFMCGILIIFYPVWYLFGHGTRGVQKTACILADAYWYYFVVAFEKWGRWKVEFSGDEIPLRETAIIIANHRWYLDWLMVFFLAFRKGRLGCMKFFAKKSIKWIPGFGWGIAILGTIFVSRNWMNDANTIMSTFQQLKANKLPFWLLNHLEGTRFAPEKLKQSQDFARQKNLPVLNHVLLPRMKGFIATVNALREVSPVIYDVTIVYEDGIKYPTVSSVILRRGGTVHVHVRRYLVDDVPKGEQELSDWVLQRWIEKDQIIDGFLKTGKFPKVRDEPCVYRPMLLV